MSVSVCVCVCGEFYNQPKRKETAKNEARKKEERKQSG